MADRLLLESDVIEAIDKHMDEYGELDDDINCILEEITSPIQVGSVKIEDNQIQKQRRILLFENENLDLEQRGNRYYLSLYNKEGKFQREVTIDVKDDYKVGLCNSK